MTLSGPARALPELTHTPRNQDPADIWRVIDRDGGVILDGFLSDELLSRLRDEAAPFISEHRPGAEGAHPFWADFHGSATKRITGLAAKSKAWVELLCDPLYAALGDHYLGAGNYYLNTAQLICIGPGETPQMLHRDEANWPSANQGDREVTITAIFALTDFTADNGATVVVPGSNRWTDASREPGLDDLGRAVMRAGSALFYSGKIIHGGGANTTQDEWRVALHAGFVLGWLRAEENHQLTTPLEAARSMPERVQTLLGFRSYGQPMGGRLGLVDYEDAAKLLERPID